MQPRDPCRPWRGTLASGHKPRRGLLALQSLESNAQLSFATRMEDWTCLGQHKRHPEFPVVIRESRRNSRKTTWLPRHRKMKPFPATAPQEKSHVRNWRSNPLKRWCCSVAQSCLTLCDPMDYSTPGLPVPHNLLKFAQIHVHCISDAIQPFHPLMPTLFSCPQSFPASGTFPMSQQFASDDQNTRVSASASVLPTNIQD